MRSRGAAARAKYPPRRARLVGGRPCARWRASIEVLDFPYAGVAPELDEVAALNLDRGDVAGDLHVERVGTREAVDERPEVALDGAPRRGGQDPHEARVASPRERAAKLLECR